MNKSMVIGLVIGAVVVTAGGAIASFKWGGSDYADVTNVKPVMETIRTPREDCKDVQVTEQAPVKDEKRVAGAAIGAVVGAVIGHQIGGGSGKTAATVAGAAGGGYAGSKVQKRMQENNTVTTTRRDCKTVYDETQKLVGYDVTYSWDGHERTVRMDHDPGRRLLVKDGQPVLGEAHSG